MSTNDTYVCRCERVPAADVDEAMNEGNLTINDIKRRTGAGMGICQGIFCVGEIGYRLAEAGVNPAEIELMTSRPPTRLLPLKTAATTAEESDQ